MNGVVALLRSSIPVFQNSPRKLAVRPALCDLVILPLTGLTTVVIKAAFCLSPVQNANEHLSSKTRQCWNAFLKMMILEQIEGATTNDRSPAIFV